MKERFYTTVDAGVKNDMLTPAEQFFFGASLEVGNRFVNPKQFSVESAAKVRVDPEFLVPVSLNENTSRDNLRNVRHARRSRAVIPIDNILDESSQDFVRQLGVTPIAVIKPLPRPGVGHKIAPVWEFHLVGKTGEKRDDAGVINRLKFDEDWNKCLVLTSNDNDETFVVLDPELAQAELAIAA
jgi:hypothetical protein